MKKRLIQYIRKIITLYFSLIQARALRTRIKNNAFIVNSVVKCTGKRNQLVVGPDSSLKNCSFIIMGDNNVISIGSHCKFDNVEFWIEDNGNSILIGNNCTIESGSQMAACEGTLISIGNDCMFSHDVLIRTTDSHSIINQRGERINSALDIVIGDHVWLGIRSLILKGSLISQNVIVGAGSIVSSKIKNTPGDMLVGTPAKTVKQNINWIRARI